MLKLIIDVVVVVVLRGLEIRNVSGAAFGLVTTMLGATFHLFVLSLQTPMYETDENKNNGSLHMQNVTGNETLAAAMYEKNLYLLYPHVQFANNLMPITSNITESPEDDENLFHSSGNVPLKSIFTTHANASSTSCTLWNNSIEGNATNTSNKGYAPNSNGNALLSPP